MAIANMSDGLIKAGVELTLLAMNTSKHFVEKEDVQNTDLKFKAIHTVEVDNRIKIIDAFFNLFSKSSYHLNRFISAEFENKLIQILKTEKFDVIQLETMYLAPYISTIRKYSDAKIA